MNTEIEITIKRTVNIEYMIKYMTDFRYDSECSKKEVDILLESAVGVIEYLNEENKRLQSLVNQQSKMLNLKKETEGKADEEKEINCKNCEYNKECKIDSIKKTKTNLLEENKQTCEFSCFGNYGEEDEWEDDCEECMYAIECKKLYEQRGEKNDE